MCKIAAVAGIKKAKAKDVWDFMEFLGSQIGFGNNDGLGYAAVTKAGSLFGERWLYNNQAFAVNDSKADKFIDQLKGHVSEKKAYNSFGTIDKEHATSILLHTRFATTGHGMKNTHPFVDSLEKPTMALIHNGMISNHHKLIKNYSTCDSETILTEYMKHDVETDVKHFQKVANVIEGWYAAMLINDKGYIDIFTDGTRLGFAFIHDLDCFVFSTDVNDIIEVANTFGYKYSHVSKIKKGVYLRVDAFTGRLLTKSKFKPIERWSYNGPSIIDVSMAGKREKDVMDENAGGEHSAAPFLLPGKVCSLNLNPDELTKKEKASLFDPKDDVNDNEWKIMVNNLFKKAMH